MNHIGGRKRCRLLANVRIGQPHDANLVVNGDAELVIHCDYESETDRSKGKIANVGSIDIKEIRDVITTIMEGGQKAFDLRKKKYGF